MKLWKWIAIGGVAAGSLLILAGGKEKKAPPPPPPPPEPGPPPNLWDEIVDSLTARLESLDAETLAFTIEIDKGATTSPGAIQLLIEKWKAFCQDLQVSIASAEAMIQQPVVGMPPLEHHTVQLDVLQQHCDDNLSRLRDALGKNDSPAGDVIFIVATFRALGTRIKKASCAASIRLLGKWVEDYAPTHNEVLFALSLEETPLGQDVGTAFDIILSKCKGRADYAKALEGFVESFTEFPGLEP